MSSTIRLTPVVTIITTVMIVSGIRVSIAYTVWNMISCGTSQLCMLSNPMNLTFDLFTQK